MSKQYLSLFICLIQLFFIPLVQAEPITTGMQEELLQLINNQRQNNSLAPLCLSPVLSKVDIYATTNATVQANAIAQADGYGKKVYRCVGFSSAAPWSDQDSASEIFTRWMDNSLTSYVLAKPNIEEIAFLEPAGSSVAIVFGDLTNQDQGTCERKSPDDNNHDKFVQELLSLTNAERDKLGLPPLCLSSLLNQSAQSHAEDMANNDYYSHTGLDGSSPTDRIRATGYVPHATAENIAAGQQTPAEVLAAWMNSPGHRANILNPMSTEIGLGYATNPSSRYYRYWVQNFARPHGDATCIPLPTRTLIHLPFLNLLLSAGEAK